MQEIEIIRETIHYVEEHRGRITVIKLGRRILSDAEMLGVTKDIKQLHGAGIPVIVCHSNPDFDLAIWPSIRTLANIRDRLDSEGILSDLGTEKTPVVLCGTQSIAADDEEAVNLAIRLHAHKLVYLTHRDGIFRGDRLIQEMTSQEGREMLRSEGVITSVMRDKLAAAVRACENGVTRVHIVNGLRASALLREMFSCEGVGTMIYSHSGYKQVRKAKPTEISDIVDLLQTAHLLSPIIPQEIAAKIDDFWVFVVDEQLHGCVMIHEHPAQKAVEIAFLATSQRYEQTNTLEELFSHAVELALKLQSPTVIVPIDRNTLWLSIYPWFLRRGFRKGLAKEIWPLSTTKVWIMEKVL